MRKLLFILFSSVASISLGIVAFLISSFGFSLVFVRLVLGGQTTGSDTLAIAFWASIIGLLTALLSLIPSYKLSLKFAKWLEETRGIKIENPKKLFLAALGILLLPLILLIIWGAIASASKPDSPKPEKPPKAVHHRCKPLKKPKRNGKPRKPKKHPLKNPCTALYNLDQIVSEEEEVAEVLPELLSAELTQNFSDEELEAAIVEAAEIFGEIESITYPGGFTVQGDWAEAEIELTTTKDQTLKYLVIFHKEGVNWKIFGTEEI